MLKNFPRFWKNFPRFLGNVGRFFGKRPMFLLGAWRRMNHTSENHFECSRFSSFPPLSRVRVCAHPAFLHFLLSHLHKKMGVVY